MTVWQIFLSGGYVMLPLLLLALTCLAVIFDKIFTLKKNLKLPASLISVVKNHQFNQTDFESEISELSANNFYRQFFVAFNQNRNQPSEQLKAFLEEEAKELETKMSANLWLLETIITSAPLLGLLGTIIGMMSSFKILGEAGVVNPVGVSAGVAESLIATAFGLVIALIALFAFNFFEKINNQKLDELERIASRLAAAAKI